MTVADTDDESGVQDHDGFVSVVSQRSRRRGGLVSNTLLIAELDATVEV